MFPPQTKASDVHERLKLYFLMRRERVEYVQDFGRGYTYGTLGPLDRKEFARVVFGHDAWEEAEKAFSGRTVNEIAV